MNARDTQNMIYVYIGLLLAYQQAVTTENVLRRLRCAHMRVTRQRHPESDLQKLEQLAEAYTSGLSKLVDDCVEQYHARSDTSLEIKA